MYWTTLQNQFVVLSNENINYEILSSHELTRGL